VQLAKSQRQRRVTMFLLGAAGLRYRQAGGSDEARLASDFPDQGGRVKRRPMTATEQSHHPSRLKSSTGILSSNV